MVLPILGAIGGFLGGGSAAALGAAATLGAAGISAYSANKSTKSQHAIGAQSVEQADRFFKQGRQHELDDRAYALERYDIERGHTYQNAKNMVNLGYQDHANRSNLDYRYFLKTADKNLQNTQSLDSSRFGLERQAKEADFDMLASKGLTPQEIIGSPIGGGVSGGTSGATLGSNGRAEANMAAAIQARASAENSAADRRAMLQAESMRAQTQLGSAAIQAESAKTQAITQAVTQAGGSLADIAKVANQETTKRRGQDIDLARTEIAAAAQKHSAKLSAQATKYSANQHAAAQKFSATLMRQTAIENLAENSRVNDTKIGKIVADTALVYQDHRIKEVMHSERWEKLFAGMSSENVLASVVAVQNGVDVKSVLKGMKPTSKQQADNLKRFMLQVTGNKSIVGENVNYATGQIDQAVQGILRFFK